MLLTARRRGQLVAIEVWDTGPGIAPQERDQIFEEFQRGAASARSGGAGFGLGLAIVRRMADLLGHELGLDSRVGHGSRFRVTAPYAAPPSKSEPATTMTSSNESYLVARPLIVIDNDLSVLGAMQTLLSRWGADVRLARDLDDVSEILADPAFAPAIILADYHLDGSVLGIDAVARIRQGLACNVPAILITADRDHVTAKAARKSNCELLYKPVRPAELRALMQHLLA